MAGVTPLSVPKGTGKQPRKLKSILKSLKDDRTVLLSRPRVVFRMFSLVASGVVVGASGHILFHYLDTRSVEGINGEPIWKQDIQLTPTNILLAVSAYVFLLDLVFSIFSFWPKVYLTPSSPVLPGPVYVAYSSEKGRYLKNKIVAALALLHSTISLVGGIISLGFSEEKRNPNSMYELLTIRLSLSIANPAGQVLGLSGGASRTRRPCDHGLQRSLQRTGQCLVTFYPNWLD